MDLPNKITKSQYLSSLKSIFKTYATFIILLSTVTLYSCSDSTNPEDLEPKELKPKETKTSDRGEEELLNEAQRYYGNGLYSLAREKFQSLLESYPNSNYKEFSELKIADTFFESLEYKDAAKSYEAFYREHPSSSSAPYALLRTGRSNHLSFKGVGRDVSPLEKSLEIYNQLLEKFPDSIYTPTAKEYKAEVQKNLADQEAFVSGYYYSRDVSSAGDAREREFSKKLTQIEKLDRIAKSSDEEATSEEDSENESDDSSESNSESKSVQKLSAPALVAAEVLNTKKNASSGSRSRAGLSDNVEESDSSGSNHNKSIFLRAECTTGSSPVLSIYLDALNKIDQNIPRIDSVSTNEYGETSIKLPIVVEKSEVIDCLRSRDLVIDMGGTISITGAKIVNILTVDAPARIIFNLE